jgi:putative DNA methylase
VDLAQAAIGPGMAVYTRYGRVLDAEGKPLSVREALALINQTLDEALGESAAAELVVKLGAKAEIARELAYRLYTLCERKKRASEALAYNGLVQSWPEITRLARESAARAGTAQADMFV